MRLQRFGTFTGGLDLPEEKFSTRDKPTAPIARPLRLSVPLDPCQLGGSQPCVIAGQRVRAGELLARSADNMPVFAPLDGAVAGFGQCVLAGGAGPFTSPTVELTDLSPVQPWENAAPTFDWRAAPRDVILTRIAEGGLTTLADPSTPLARLCRLAMEARVDTLIANGLENQPYLTGEHRLLVEHGPQVVAGLAILAKALSTPHVALAVDRRNTDHYRQLVKPARDNFKFQPVAVLHKYPSGHNVILAKMLTRREVPLGGTTLDARVAVVNAAACLAVYRWVACGQPSTHRVVTVAGMGVEKPGNYLVPFGAPAAHVLAETEVALGSSWLCQGGPMTGVSLPAEAVVGPASGALLSLPAEGRNQSTACIRCGWCTDHCPVRLDVSNLNDLYELGRVKRARRYGVQACLGCGSCSYVCPARLPLAHRMQQLKRAASLLSDAPGPAKE